MREAPSGASSTPLRLRSQSRQSLVIPRMARVSWRSAEARRQSTTTGGSVCSRVPSQMMIRMFSGKRPATSESERGGAPFWNRAVPSAWIATTTEAPARECRSESVPGASSDRGWCLIVFTVPTSWPRDRSSETRASTTVVLPLFESPATVMRRGSGRPGESVDCSIAPAECILFPR